MPSNIFGGSQAFSFLWTESCHFTAGRRPSGQGCGSVISRHLSQQKPLPPIVLWGCNGRSSYVSPSPGHLVVLGFTCQDLCGEGNGFWIYIIALDLETQRGNQLAPCMEGRRIGLAWLVGSQGHFGWSLGCFSTCWSLRSTFSVRASLLLAGPGLEFQLPFDQKPSRSYCCGTRRPVMSLQQ